MKIVLTKPTLWYIHVRTQYEETEMLDALKDLEGMTDDDAREYVFRYLEHVISSNAGTHDLFDSEWKMIRELDLADELGIELPEEEN